MLRLCTDASSQYRRVWIWALSMMFAFMLAPPSAHANVIFDKASGSYFELVMKPGVNWAMARQEAEKRTYKGIRGRLAVIKSRETHEFISDNFMFNGRTRIWIGLRYFCTNRALVWVGGDRVNVESDFQAWSKQWANTHVRCSTLGYMPVFILNSEGSFRWRASGPIKAWHHYLIEYPSRSR